MGRGRRFVRSILASLAISYTWFSAFADAAQAKVPKDVHPSFTQSTASPLPALQTRSFLVGASFVKLNSVTHGAQASHTLVSCISRYANGWTVATFVREVYATCNEACCCCRNDESTETML